MSYLFDHLWQSLLFTAIAWGLAALTRNNVSLVRLWIWRVAALKFVAPLGLLYALGVFIGYPVRHSAVPPPEGLRGAVAVILRFFAPAQGAKVTPLLLILAVVLASLVTAAVLLAIRRAERRARDDVNADAARAAHDGSYQPLGLGFLRAALLTGCTVGVAVIPIVVGAVTNRLDRQAVLAIDTRQLRSATITMNETDHVTARLPVVVATHDGVLIRDTNLQDLIALTYGIGQFEVFGGALPFLESPHYDVRIGGPVRDPARFDPYALHEPVTRYLYDRFGVAIRVNGSCQDPCGNQESFVIERLR